MIIRAIFIYGLATLTLLADGASEPKNPAEAGAVYVIPIEGEITSPQLFIVRRALKEATENAVAMAILKINTPGGQLETTLDIMEAIQRFEGESIAWVVDKALSAGAYIAATTNEIYMAPQSIIGAAAVIQATGQDVPPTAKLKIESYLNAKLRTLDHGQPFRAKVLRAMMDESYVLKIGDNVLKPAGELLSLTAAEATQSYGEPPEPLLATGIAKSVQDILQQAQPGKVYHIRDFQITWSEELAKWLSPIAPLLLGVAMMLIFIEMKTPGFGIFGGLGLALAVIFFVSNYVAGLAGYEPLLLFLVGLGLIVVELFLFPGTMIAGVLGFICAVGGLLWSMSDIWPDQDIATMGKALLDAAGKLGIAVIIAFLGILTILRFLPKTVFWHRVILHQQGARAQEPLSPMPVINEPSPTVLPPVGAQGQTVTYLFPSGQVEIAGQRYPARLKLGFLKKGEQVKVIAHQGHTVVVAKKD